MELDQIPLTGLKGVGSKLAEKLGHLHLQTVQDLLFHLPHRYEDRTLSSPIAELLPGMQCNVEGFIQDCQIVPARRRMMVCRISDGNGSLTLRFFNFSQGQKAALASGRRLRCFGEIKAGHYGLEIIHPEYKLLDEASPLELEEKLTPVYPTTEGLRQQTLRNLTDQALALLAT